MKVKSNILNLLIVTLFANCQTKDSDTFSGLLLPDSTSLKEIDYAAAAGDFDVVKTVVDYEENMPPCGKQGTQGSCVTWALGYNLISYYEKRYTQGNYISGTGSLDSTKIFSPAFIFNHYKQRRYPYECSTGMRFVDAIKTVENFGICKWSTLPYVESSDGCFQLVTSESLNEAAAYRYYKFERVLITAESIQYYLSNGYPLLAGIFTSNELKKLGDNAPKDRLFIWNPGKYDKQFYHAVLIVGYNKPMRTFKIMNSWGQQWGNNGYATIPADRLLERLRELYLCYRVLKNTTYVKNLNQVDLSSLRLDEFSASLPASSLINLRGYSMMVRGNVTKDSVRVDLFEKGSSERLFKYSLSENDVKQTNIGNGNLQFSAKNLDSQKNTLRVDISIKGSTVDKSLRQVDSLFNDDLRHLLEKSSLTDSEEGLKNQLLKRNYEVKTVTLEVKNRNIPLYMAISVTILFGIAIGLLVVKTKS